MALISITVLLCSILVTNISCVSLKDANDRIKECCRQNNIEECGVLCKFDITPKELESNAEICFDKIPVWLYCASEGRNNTNECKKQGVPRKCIDFCNDSGPKLCFDEKMIDNFRECGSADNIRKIFTAHRNRLEPSSRYQKNHRFARYDCPDT